MQKETLKVGMHHLLPQLLRNDKMSLPNNPNMVEKRLMDPKRRFQKDLKFYENYNKFIEEIISKGYARKAKTNPPKEEHGIYNIMVFITHTSSAN